MKFENILESLFANNGSDLERQLKALSEDQFKSLMNVRIPNSVINKSLANRDGKFSHLGYNSTLPKAAGDGGYGDFIGNIFFQILFERLGPEALKVALGTKSDHDESGHTLLHCVCCVIDKENIKTLVEKLGMDIFLALVTSLPCDEGITPLGIACLSSSSTDLFDTVYDHEQDLAVGMIKGSPEGSKTLLQTLFDAREFVMEEFGHAEWLRRIQYPPLSKLENTDRFDAVKFSSKSKLSPLQWACGEGELDIVKVLLDGFDNSQIAALIMERIEENRSPLHMALNNDQVELACFLCQEIHDLKLRMKALLAGVQEGQSLLQKLVEQEVDIDDIESLFKGLNDQQRDQLIVGDASHWKQEIECSDHALRQMFSPSTARNSFGHIPRFINAETVRELVATHLNKIKQSPVIRALNNWDPKLAEYLWEKITDLELKYKVLLFKPEGRCSLLMKIYEERGMEGANTLLDKAGSAARRENRNKVLYNLLLVLENPMMLTLFSSE